MQQMVRGFTRMNPPRMLDLILTTLGSYYQTPMILPPLDADLDSNGSPSDHLVPVMKPINTINNRSSRTSRDILIRPVPKSGLHQLRNWVEAQDWTENFSEESVDKKAELLIGQMRSAFDQYLPEKVIRIASDDKPWFTDELKRLDRRKRREYSRNRKSDKYKNLCCIYQEKVTMAKRKYQLNMIDNIKSAHSSVWFDKSEVIQVEEISHLSDLEEAEIIADKLSAISNSYKGVKMNNILIPPSPPRTYRRC